MTTLALALPQYQSHKQIYAGKITNAQSHGETGTLYFENDLEVVVTAEWVQKRVPEGQQLIGGYYVVYEDGYTSWSPAATFESGYTPVPADWKERLKTEKRELDEKITRLADFMTTPEHFDLAADERHRQVRQYHAMCNYSGVLGERIAAF